MNMTEIRVYKMRSRDVGGCSSCNRFITVEGSVDHDVWVLLLGTSEVRVCSFCKSELMDLL